MPQNKPTNIIDQLARDENLRLHPYTDTVGKLTIGYGRNLTDVGISEAEAKLMLIKDINDVTRRLSATYQWYVDLLYAREFTRAAAIENVAFNIGLAGLAAFTNMLEAMAHKDYNRAAAELLDSKYAKQVGARATRLATQLRTGEWQ